MSLFTPCPDGVFVTTVPEPGGYRTVINNGPLDGTPFVCSGDPQDQHDGAVWLAKSARPDLGLGVENPQSLAYI